MSPTVIHVIIKWYTFKWNKEKWVAEGNGSLKTGNEELRVNNILFELLITVTEIIKLKLPCKKDAKNENCFRGWKFNHLS